MLFPIWKLFVMYKTWFVPGSVFACDNVSIIFSLKIFLLSIYSTYCSIISGCWYYWYHHFNKSTILRYSWSCWWWQKTSIRTEKINQSRLFWDHIHYYFPMRLTFPVFNRISGRKIFFPSSWRATWEWNPRYLHSRWRWRVNSEGKRNF